MIDIDYNENPCTHMDLNNQNMLCIVRTHPCIDFHEIYNGILLLAHAYHAPGHIMQSSFYMIHMIHIMASDILFHSMQPMTITAHHLFQLRWGHNSQPNYFEFVLLLTN